MEFSVGFPRVVRFGAGVSKQLPDLLQQMGLSRPFIMTDRHLWESGRLEIIRVALERDGIFARFFLDTVPEPDVPSIELALADLSRGEHDCIVAFGGGSPIDSAKAVGVLAVHGGSISDYKAPHQQHDAGLPVIAIPTTAGTGSEATRFTIITDPERDEKMLCAGLAYLPIAALVDFELTLTKPARLSADTAIDALTHAIEAYVSRRANPVSDLFALAAMEAIAPNLRPVWTDGNNQEAREQLMLGATYAGVAFSNSSVALVHGMSRPIGAHFHVPHGLSNAMLLPLVTQFSATGNMERYAQCARKMGVASDQEGDQMAVSRLIEELASINRDLVVPTPQAYGISRERWEELVPVMVQQAIASGSPANNPRIATPEEMHMLYLQAWDRA